jgi:nitrile hydratase
MGGQPTDEPLHTAEHVLADWEVLADAVAVALSRKGIRSTDESRRAMEDMPAAEYLTLGYYERWVRSTEDLLVEKGVLTRAEIDARQAELAATWGVS